MIKTLRILRTKTGSERKFPQEVKKILLTMKLITLLLTIAGFAVHANGYAQGITLSVQNELMENVFRQIEKQSGYSFLYYKKQLEQAKRITVHIQGASLAEALNRCFEEQPLTYTIMDRTIVIKRKEAVPVKMASKRVFTDPGLLTVKGKVIDEKGQPVPKASVSVKGARKATATNSNGEFELKDIEEKATLIISSIGFHTQEISVDGRLSIIATLEIAVGNLDEAIVVPYTTTTNRANTASLTVVQGEDIQNLPNRSFDKSLQGMVPGLLVTSGTGQPGGGVSNFVLRGISSAVDPSEASVRNPLIIIDGVPVTQDHFQIYIDNVRTPIANPLSQLNTSDIESITVLKDAAAVALYGARASNGVIVVTTKKGRSGKTIFNVRHQTDIASPLNGKVNVLSQEEYVELLGESLRNWKPWYSDPAKVLDTLKKLFPVREDGSFYPHTDWQDELFNKNAVTISNEISMSGGNDKNSFYINLEYTKQDGVVRNTGFDRKSGRINFENRPASWLRLGINASFSHTKQDYGGAARGYDGPVVSSMSPLNPVRDEQGNYFWNYKYGGGPQSGSEFANPVAQAAYNINRNTAFRSLTRLYGEVSFLKYLKLTSTLGFDYMLAESKEKADPRLYDPGNQASGVGRIEELDTRRNTIVSTNMIRFDKTFNNRHGLNLILGQEAQIHNQKTLLVAVKNLTLPYYDQISSPGVEILRQSGAQTKETLLSYFGQANYGFLNRYFLTGSVRRDGSSRFGEDKRFGTYWSVGTGWVISSEPFMKATSSWLDYLKLRGSIGAAGNAAAINRFTRFDRLEPQSYLGGTAVLATNVPGAPGVHWESTFTWDAGLELRLMNQRVSVTADIYKKNTTDLLYAVQLPLNSGYFSVLSNIGEMENKGTELSLSIDIIRNNRARWNLSGNWSSNQNKLTKANVPQAALATTHLGNKEGENFNSFYLVRWAGVNPADGMAQWLDTAGNTITSYSTAHRMFVGKPQPDGFGAVSTTVSYNCFDLSAMLYYQYGYQIYISDELMNDGRYPFMNQDERALDRWQKPGDIASNPKRIFNNSNGGGLSRASTRYLYDGDHIRLQNVTLTYNFSKNITDRLRMTNLKVFVQGHNLAVWTKFPGQDPGNANVGGTVGLRYPNQRSFSFGIHTAF